MLVQRLALLYFNVQTEIKCTGLKSLYLYYFLISLNRDSLWSASVSRSPDTDIVRVGRAQPGLGASRFHNQEQWWCPRPGCSDTGDRGIPPAAGLWRPGGKNTPLLPPPEQNMVNKQQQEQEVRDHLPAEALSKTRNILWGCNVTSRGFIWNVTSAWETNKSKIIREQYM